MRLRRADSFDWMHRMFPWFFGLVLALIVAVWVGMGIVAYLAISSAVDAGPTGIAEAIGRLWAAVQRGTSQ